MENTLDTLVKELQALKTQEEAGIYLIKEMKTNPYTWSNIKYITGYLGNEERNRIMNLFKQTCN